MRANRVLVDRGPLVAIFSARDANHARCVGALDRLAPPLFTCWPVLTEAAWMLRGRPDLVQKVLGMVGSDLLHLLPLDGTDAPAVAALIRKYRELALQLADAALLHLANRERIETIFTLDVRDFSVPRTSLRRPLTIIPEP